MILLYDLLMQVHNWCARHMPCCAGISGVILSLVENQGRVVTERCRRSGN